MVGAETVFTFLARVYTKNPNVYQDRLGTNIGKVGKRHVSAHRTIREQINLARQNIYDGTWNKIPSQGWMFVPAPGNNDK